MPSQHCDGDCAGLRERLLIAEFDASVAMTERDSFALSLLMEVRNRVANLGGYQKHTARGDDFYVKRDDVMALLHEATFLVERRDLADPTAAPQTGKRLSDGD